MDSLPINRPLQRRKTRKDLQSDVFSTSCHFALAAQMVKNNKKDEFFQFLFDVNITVSDLENYGGPNFIHVAAEYNHVELAREMIRRIRADSGDEKTMRFINYQDKDNWTALMLATKEDHIDFVDFLISAGAKVDLEDMGGFTALNWSCYAGHSDITRLLISHKSPVNHYDNYHMNGLLWSAGRGFYQVVDELLKGGAKVDSGDKYGTTALTWAARRGYIDIVNRLLEGRANVNVNGMLSWTPLIVAAKGNHNEVVEALLRHKPELNVIDAQGLSPLMIASKEGNINIANALISAGAHVNLMDRHKDTSLIHAAKSGHVLVVESLLKSAAHVDHTGYDRKTALYWAIDKGYVKVVEAILRAKPNIDIITKDADTCLMKAVRCRNLSIVKLLIERGPKVHMCDKYGDTAFHIAIRSQSKAIVEVLMRNPRNAQYLYQPNKRGETPYQIDQAHQKPLLHNLFGSAPSQKKLIEKQTQLGYDLYSSAIANLLCEPALKLPISIGLYAKWGSGKSFLVAKLKDDLITFTQSWSEQHYSITWLLTFALTLFMLSLGTFVYILTDRDIGLTFFFMLAILCMIIISIGLFYLGHARYGWSLGDRLRKFMTLLKLTIQICFAHPPNITLEEYTNRPVRFLFTGQHIKISSDHSVNELMATIVNSLRQAMEEEFGFLPCRLYHVFQPKSTSGGKWRWRSILCLIPIFYLVLALLSLLLLAIMVISIAGLPRVIEGFSQVPILIYISVGLMSIIGAWCLTNIATPFKILRYTAFVPKLDSRELLMKEIEILQSSAHCLDSFKRERQSRFVILVDALESIYESERFISFLEAINALFLTSQTVSSQAWAPFVVIMALDPHHHSGGKTTEFLKTIVHLPFYLQNSQLRRVKVAQQTSMRADFKSSMTSIVDTVQGSGRANNLPRGKTIRESTTKRGGGLKPAESLLSLAAPFSGSATEAPTKVLLTDDYFSDVNPKSIRRIMNIAFIEGRLMKAFNIDFNWQHLTTWVNITEQWPLRVMTMVVCFEMYENKYNDDGIPLKTIYDKVAPHIPTSNKVSNRDNDEKKLSAFLSYHHSSLTLGDLKIFSPFTINLDPFLRKTTQETLSEVNLFPRSESTSARPSIIPVLSPAHRPSSSLQPFPVAHSQDTVSPMRGKIGELTVDGVINMLKSIDGFSGSNMDAYTEKIRSNNINGRVLASISPEDMNDLKSVLGFTFGDWLLFKKAISEGITANIITSFPIKNSPPQPIQANIHCQGAATLLPIPQLDIMGYVRGSNALEKQVTMEETALASMVTIDSPIEEENLSVCSNGTCNNEVAVLYISAPSSRLTNQPSVSFNPSESQEIDASPSVSSPHFPVEHIIEVEGENGTPPVTSPSKQSVASIASSSGSSPRRRPLERQSTLNESGRASRSGSTKGTRYVALLHRPESTKDTTSQGHEKESSLPGETPF